MKNPESLIPEETNSQNKAMTAEEKQCVKNILLDTLKHYGGLEPSDVDSLLDAGETFSLLIGYRKYHSQQSQAEQKELVELKRKVEELTKQLSISVSLDVLKEVLAAEKEKSAKLVEAITKALSIKDLWLISGWVSDEHENEAVALKAMYDNFESALKDYEAK
jgi:hypothetical protein